MPRTISVIPFLLVGALGLGACQHSPAPPLATPQATQWTEGWLPFALPGKPETEYSPAFIDGRWVLKAKSERSAGMYRKLMRIEPAQLGAVSFSWKTVALVEGADVSRNETEDAPVRVMLAFEGDHARLSQRTRMMFDLMHTVSGEKPPFATLMYVWDNQAAPESLVINKRSDRIRKIVLESGPAHLGQWRHYRRDIRADFRLAFGEDPGPLIGVAVMTDSDNTQTRAEAWYGEIRFD